MNKFAPLVACLALAVAACGGNDPAVTKKSDTTTTSTTAKSKEKSKDGKAVRTYFEAFSTRDATKMRSEMLPVSAPGSAAAAYADIQAAVSEAAAASGNPYSEDTAKFSAEKVSTCSKNPLTQEENCTDFTNFVVNDEGLLSDFDVSGNTVSKRIGKSDASETVAVGATVRFVGAYKSGSSDDLLVVLSITAGPTDTTVAGYSASYVGADGKQLTAEVSYGPNELKPGATSLYGIYFSGGDLGGTVSVDVTNAKYDSGTATFPIKPAF